MLTELLFLATLQYSVISARYLSGAVDSGCLERKFSMKMILFMATFRGLQLFRIKNLEINFWQHATN